MYRQKENQFFFCLIYNLPVVLSLGTFLASSELTHSTFVKDIRAAAQVLSSSMHVKEMKATMLLISFMLLLQMGKIVDLCKLDKYQIVMTRWLDQSISKRARLVGWSWSAVVSAYRKWSEEGKTMNCWQAVGWPWHHWCQRWTEAISNLTFETEARDSERGNRALWWTADSK